MPSATSRTRGAVTSWELVRQTRTLAEDVGPDGRLHSFFDALWWATTTITTVGYGDVFPVTTAGRIVGGFTILVGISTFAIVTAKVAEWLVRSPTEVTPAEDPQP